MHGRWSGMAAVVLAASVGASAAWAQVGVGMGSNAARPVAPESADTAAPSNVPAVPAAAMGRSEVSKPSQSGQLPERVAPTRDYRPPTSLMGMSSGTAQPPSTAAVDLSAVLNTGSRMQRDNASKICPAGTVNRNNFCVPPATGVMSR